METVASIDRLASLLEYPDRTFMRRLEDCRAADPGLEPFAARISALPLTALQELYTKTFDFSAGCTLDMGWHLFGDRPERGAFLADMRPRLAAAGIDEGAELPDHLPLLLKLVGRLPAHDAAALYTTLTPAVGRLAAALAANGNPYAPLVSCAFGAARPQATVGV